MTEKKTTTFSVEATMVKCINYNHPTQKNTQNPGFFFNVTQTIPNNTLSLIFRIVYFELVRNICIYKEMYKVKIHTVKKKSL